MTSASIRAVGVMEKQPSCQTSTGETPNVRKNPVRKELWNSVEMAPWRVAACCPSADTALASFLVSHPALWSS